MTIFGSIKNGVKKGFHNTKKGLSKGFNNLKHSSFRDAILLSEGKDRDFRKAAGIQGMEDTTQLELIERGAQVIEEGTGVIANAPGVRHIPGLGYVLSELHSGAGELRMATEELNAAIDKQDRNAKRGRSSIHDYARIGKSGIAFGKSIKKNYKKRSSHKEEQARAMKAGFIQHAHRGVPGLVI